MKPAALAFRALAVIVLQAALSSNAFAAEKSAVRGPVPPQDSLANFVVAPGLKIELVAHEPNVIDPVAIRFDEEGRMWVVEMRDYPTGIPGKPVGSRISVLQDRDNDGFYESATVFADGLPFATGLQPWKGGVFVTMAGRVAYLKDSDGDGRADVNETWYMGFAEGNTQLRANHPTLALDNHIYIANGLRGGTIVDASRPNVEPVSISGMDFRFDPLTRKFEAVSGAGQFGLAFDDYGNRFVCSNRNPAIHIVLEDRYLKRNPLVAVDAVAHDVAKAGDESRVFPITRAWTTSHLHAGQFTSACGLAIYRGDALPAEFYGNIFVCEPTGHLVHREIMKPHGVTFASQPAYDGTEFLASRDEWFSPVNLETGPDGALYVVDMYRAVIEHPEWMPEELRKRPDLLWGNDRGRIYRIVPQEFRRPPQPQLSGVSSDALVDLLAHPNAWWRETAARLLPERQDKTIGQKLATVVAQHQSPLARIHALRAFDGLRLLDRDLLVHALQDEEPRVVEQALLVVESSAAGPELIPYPASNLCAHPDARVRFQARLTTEQNSLKPPIDRWERCAILIASGDRGGSELARVLKRSNMLATRVPEPDRLVAELTRLAAASPKASQQAIALKALLTPNDYQRLGLTAFLNEAVKRGASVDELKARLDENQKRELDFAFTSGKKDATDTDESEFDRCEAVDMLAFSDDAAQILAPLALNDPSQMVRAHAVTALRRSSDIRPWRALLERFSSESPALQRAILDGVFADAERTRVLLDEIAAKRIAATALDANRINLLLNHRDEAIRERAKMLFADAVPTDRREALATYQSALELKADASRGRAVFQKQCATCHHIAGVGVDVAPDISDSRERSPEQLLTDIIQPNRAIDSNYFSYTAVAADGRVYTGILTAETSTSVTLKQAEGKIVVLRRSEIEDLHSDGVSLMPDGLEKLIPPQDMADLISFIKNWRYLDARSAPPLPGDAQRPERPPGKN
ncbi:MAG TPA: PVC-type heme-binding CxxCH protein [Lacipirellulaceae bacterium]|jgi:putative membrane-bound dehydrogenase-like protein|nr:PVC-type heme-binding CxxCH protein [Lacipirellulaceae bacterium]